MGVLGGALGGVASLVGDLFGASSAKGQQKFEERMADTTYQRTVADMKKAGLNPMMMMAKGGGPDPMPAGTGVAQGRFYGDAASKAASLALTQAQVEATNASAAQTRAQTLGLLPEQISQLKALATKSQLEARAAPSLLQGQIDLLREQGVTQTLLNELKGGTLPYDIKAGELQPGYVSAQTAAAGAAAASSKESAAKTGLGWLGDFVGPDILGGFFNFWKKYYDDIQNAAAKRHGGEPYIP